MKGRSLELARMWILLVAAALAASGGCTSSAGQAGVGCGATGCAPQLPDCPRLTPVAGDQCDSSLGCQFVDDCGATITATCQADQTWALSASPCCPSVATLNADCRKSPGCKLPMNNWGCPGVAVCTEVYGPAHVWSFFSTASFGDACDSLGAICTESGEGPEHCDGYYEPADVHTRRVVRRRGLRLLVRRIELVLLLWRDAPRGRRAVYRRPVSMCDTCTCEYEGGSCGPITTQCVDGLIVRVDPTC
jgi:hypothetical protein